MRLAAIVNSIMSERARELAEQVLELPASEQRLVRALLDSAAEEPALSQEALDALWVEEVRKRKADVRAGRERMYTLEEAFAAVDAPRVTE
jgi:U3 small nucleolar RNA-associated protein 14